MVIKKVLFTVFPVILIFLLCVLSPGTLKTPVGLEDGLRYFALPITLCILFFIYLLLSSSQTSCIGWVMAGWILLAAAGAFYYCTILGILAPMPFMETILKLESMQPYAFSCVFGAALAIQTYKIFEPFKKRKPKAASAPSAPKPGLK